MRAKSNSRLVAAVTGILVLSLLVGCGATPVPTAVPTLAPTAAPVATKAPATAAPTAVPPTVAPTAVPKPTATTAPAGPAVGGTMVIAISTEPDTLDGNVSGNGEAMQICALLGSTLVYKDPTGKYLPYLATSWTTSADGLVWDFTLRNDIKFHDGTPMTAKDMAYSITRLKDPATKSPQLGRAAAITTTVAVDDTHLRITLGGPYPILLEQLSNTAVMQPISKAAVDKSGAQYGRNPVGVGPYKFKEWKTGDNVTIERNPDFKWWPKGVGANAGPFYIQTLKFRIIPELATQIAGLETGEIDYGYVEPKDLARFSDKTKFQQLTILAQGMNPSLQLNSTKPPFDDINVRKAFQMGIDRDTLVKVVAQGNGVAQYGPLSENMPGYNPKVADMGYKFNLAGAKKLMEQAGYTYDANGVASKGGVPLKVNLMCTAVGTDPTLAAAVKEQYKALGVEITIQQVEYGVLTTEIYGSATGKSTYQILQSGYGAVDNDIMYRWFHTSRAAALNIPAKPKDDELDKALDLTRSTADPTLRAQYINAAQEILMQKAYAVPLYAPKQFMIVNARIKGAVLDPIALLTFKVLINDAYIPAK